MAIKASGQITIVDLTDSQQLSLYLTSNLPTTQILDQATDSFNPNWINTNLKITPNVFLNQKEILLTDENLSISYKRRDGSGAESSLVTGETINQGVLTVNKNNLKEGTGLITYICYMTYNNSKTNQAVKAQADITFSLVKNGIEGENGKGISTITNYYLATNESSNITVETAGWSTAVQAISSTKKYLWNYEKIIYTNGDSMTTEPCIIGAYGDEGEQGQAGNGISSIAYFYKTTTTQTAPSAETIISTSLPTLSPENKYLWQKEVINFTDDSVEDKVTVSLLAVYGNTGNPGEDGRGIVSSVTTYQIHTSGTTEPTGNWSSTPVLATDEKPYLWTKTVINYTTGNPSVFYAISKKGDKGSQGLKGDPGANGIPGRDGIDGKTSYLHIAYANSADGSTDFSTTNSVNKLYIGQYTDFTQADSKDPTDYSWTKIKGDTGAQGPKGENGTSITIESTSITYQVSTSGTIKPIGTWSPTIPNIPNGQYLWTKTVVNYSDGNKTESYSVSYKGTNGTNGQDGAPGQDGTSSYTHIRYSNSSDGSNMSTDPTNKTYIGIYTGNSQTAPTSPTSYQWSKFKGDNGQNGTDGNGIKSISYFYATTTTQSQPSPESVTSTTIPSLSPTNKYLWQKEVIDFTDSTVSDKTTVVLLAVYGNTGPQGPAGTDGTSPYNVILTNESQTIAGSTTAAIATTITTNVIGYQGTTPINTRVGTITGLPTGMTATISNNNSKTTLITFKVTTSLITLSGQVTIPVTVGNVTINKIFSYSLSLKGSTGGTGTSASLVNISASGQIFKSTTGVDGTFTPDYIYLYPRFQTVKYSKWQYSTNGTTWKDVVSGNNGLTIGTYSSIANSLRIQNTSNLYTDTITSISFKCISSNAAVYDTVSITKIYDVTDIEIGGTNLLLKTQDHLLTIKEVTSFDEEGNPITEDKQININSNTNENSDYYRSCKVFEGTQNNCYIGVNLAYYIEKNKVKLNDILTYSIYAKTNSTSVLQPSFKIKNDNININNDVKVVNNKNLINTNKWVHLYCTFTLTEDIINEVINNKNKLLSMYINVDALNGSTIEYAAQKLETGNIPTDWSIAPEDILSEEQINNNINNSIQNATDLIDQSIDEKIDKTTDEINNSIGGLIDAGNAAIREEIDKTTGEKIRDLEKYTSELSLKGDQFNLNFEKTKGVNLIKNSVMKQYKLRGGNEENANTIKANFWYDREVKENYFDNVYYGEDSNSRANTDSGNYFSFIVNNEQNVKLDYIFSDLIDFKKSVSNIILSYKLRQDNLNNGKFFIGLVFYRANNNNTSDMGNINSETGIQNAYYIPVIEYDNSNLNNVFETDYIYKTLPITRKGIIDVEEILDVQTTEGEKYATLTYQPDSEQNTVSIININGNITNTIATNKKVMLDPSTESSVVTVKYKRTLQNFIGIDNPSDTLIKEKISDLPKSEVNIFYNNSNKKIWTYNPFSGVFVETENIYDDEALDTNIDTVRLILGIRANDNTVISGRIDISDIKLEYDSVSTIWTQNAGETYSKKYKMDEKGFSISSDTNTMFIDEDEIAAYKQDENGELDLENPTFQIKEDETILRKTTIYEELNIENSNTDRTDAFIMKQQLVNNKWYFIFY